MTRFWSSHCPGLLLCEECLDDMPSGITLVEVYEPKNKSWAYLKVCSHA